MNVLQQRRDVLADVVLARAFPVALGVLVVVRQRASGDVSQVFGTQWRATSFHMAPAQGEPAGVAQAVSENGWISLAIALPFSIWATRNAW